MTQRQPVLPRMRALLPLRIGESEPPETPEHSMPRGIFLSLPIRMWLCLLDGLKESNRRCVHGRLNVAEEDTVGASETPFLNSLPIMNWHIAGKKFRISSIRLSRTTLLVQKQYSLLLGVFRRNTPAKTCGFLSESVEPIKFSGIKKIASSITLKQISRHTYGNNSDLQEIRSSHISKTLRCSWSKPIKGEESTLKCVAVSE